ncbi:MAG: mechanosensitive ion channel family protein [Bacteroidales bacterium]|nr:mechanosensitive ion channel family protein [Bacteroidales bacterium]
MILHLLQVQVPTPDAEEIEAASDSAKAALEMFARRMAEHPQESLVSMGQKALEFGIKVLAAILIYAIGAWVIKKVVRMLRAVFEKKGSEKTLVSFVTSLVSITLTIILIIIVVGTLGVNTSSLAALLAAGGMAIGMALSGTVQNFAGGIMILMFKPFKVGDYIRAQGFEGFVTDVSIVNTKLRTFANETVILPNGTLFNGTINNFMEKEFLRESWPVDVPYGTDYEKAESILLDIAMEEEKIIKEDGPLVKKPSVHLGAMKDSSVQLVLWAWVKVQDYYPVQFSVSKKIYKRLPENGIDFPFPQLDIHVDPDKKES